MKLVLACLFACFVAGGLCSQLAAKDLVRWNTRVVAGWNEPVYLGDAKLAMTAKLDTGARTSSLNAVDLKTVIRHEKPWVEFTIRAGSGKEIRIERPVVRIARIRRASTGVHERPVISLPVCLAGYRKEIEFTLTDRSTMNFPVLIGRAFLAGRIIVNSEAALMTVESCPK